MIKLRDILVELDVKTKNKYVVYHGSGKKFQQFNIKKTTQGIIWFTSDKNKIINGDVGAESSGYIYTCEVTINNPAGWDEYDKYALYQLESMGYDGVILSSDDEYDCFVFSPKQIKILKIEKVQKNIKEDHEYRGLHTSPTKDSGAPLYDLTKIYPDDIYSNNAPRYYGDMGGDNIDIISVHLMQKARNKPNMQIKIYRAVPDINKDINDKLKYYKNLAQYTYQYGFPPMKDRIASGEFGDLNYKKDLYLDNLYKKISNLEKDKKKLSINPGDWVTLNKLYAIEHGKSNLNGKYKILTKTVPAKHLFTTADSVHEFGYDPS